jgi:DNA-binding IclR family transcriptional regulator
MLAPELHGPGYVVGPRAFELAGLYLSCNSLLDLIDAAIDRLVAEFGFVGYICKLDADDLLILRRRHGHYPLRLVRDVGERVPAFQTSAGRALMAYGSDERASAIIARDQDWAARAGEAVEELARIRRTGVATSLSTSTPGVMATAAALRDSASGETISFSVSFPASAADDVTRARIVARVRAEACGIAVVLGDRSWLARGASGQDGATSFANQDLGAHHAEPA